MAFDPKYIRNFSIVAHIDHGKSTLADQLLLQSGAITQREFREQLLDDMDLERERGITIKARAVAINYTLDGQVYELNLIDTPGHVDFHYEVSRSLAACEGAILLVDATQGVQAQTVANAFLAVGNNLAIVPVLNKIDMQASRPEEIKEEIMHTPGHRPRRDPGHQRQDRAGGARRLPGDHRAGSRPRRAIPQAPLRALIFDSKFDDYQGVITYVRVVDGVLRVGQKIRLMAGETRLRGHRAWAGSGPARSPATSWASARSATSSPTSSSSPTSGSATRSPRCPARPRSALPGYQEPVPVVFCGLFPATTTSSTTSAPPSRSWRSTTRASRSSPRPPTPWASASAAGSWACSTWRSSSSGSSARATSPWSRPRPTSPTRSSPASGETLHISNPTRIPDAGEIEEFREPIVKVNFILPADCIGAIMQLCEDRRGVYIKTEYLSPTRAILTYELPLAEMIYDLYDKLKSATRGYGTMDYELIGYRAGDLCRLDILVAGQRVDALSVVVHRAHADRRGRKLVRKLKGEIDRHQFEVAIQAAIGSRVIARETISALRKNVTAKCYGGDITRKRKLLEKQKEGKKRMKTGRERRDLPGGVPVGARRQRGLRTAPAGLAAQPVCPGSTDATDGNRTP